MSNNNENGKAVDEPLTASQAPAEPEETISEASEDGDTATLEDPAAQLAALAAERDRLADEKRELEERLLRRQAEFENFRRREAKERQEFAAYAAMDMVGALLPVLDDFERAMKAVPPESANEQSDFVKGVGMIYQRLAETLKKAGLEPIESMGKPFDPNVHHAVDRVPTEEAEDHTVLEEWQRGYNFKGRLLREAMVKVAVKPAPPSDTSQEEKQ